MIKLLEGTQGMGVILADTAASAVSIIEAFRVANVNIMVQEFIREANGADIRALVIGGEVAAAIKRVGRPGDFRANVHRGGSAMQVDLTTEERRIAVKAATALGLNVSGVDMIRSNRGPLVMEVNSSPGLEAIEGATGIDIASQIIDFLETNACYGLTATKGVG